MWRWFKHKLSAQLFESTNARMARVLEDYAEDVRNATTVVGYAQSEPEYCGKVLGKVDHHRWLLDVGWSDRFRRLLRIGNGWGSASPSARSRGGVVFGSQRPSCISSGTRSLVSEPSLRSVGSSGVCRAPNECIARGVTGSGSQSDSVLSQGPPLHPREHYAVLWDSILSDLQEGSREGEKDAEYTSQSSQSELGQDRERNNIAATGTALPPDRTLPAPSAPPSPLLDYLRVLHGVPLNQLYPSPLAESRLVFSRQPDGSVGEWQCDEGGTA